MRGVIGRVARGGCRCMYANSTGMGGLGVGDGAGGNVGCECMS